MKTSVEAPGVDQCMKISLTLLNLFKKKKKILHATPEASKFIDLKKKKNRRGGCQRLEEREEGRTGRLLFNGQFQFCKMGRAGDIECKMVTIYFKLLNCTSRRKFLKMFRLYN